MPLSPPFSVPGLADLAASPHRWLLVLVLVAAAVRAARRLASTCGADLRSWQDARTAAGASVRWTTGLTVTIVGWLMVGLAAALAPVAMATAAGLMPWGWPAAAVDAVVAAAQPDGALHAWAVRWGLFALAVAVVCAGLPALTLGLVAVAGGLGRMVADPTLPWASMLGPAALLLTTAVVADLHRHTVLVALRRFTGGVVPPSQSPSAHRAGDAHPPHSQPTAGADEASTAAENPADTTTVALSIPGAAARLRFDDIHGMADLKARLLAAGREAARRHDGPRAQAHAQTRNGILLHGAPGNGKTMVAEALAGELGLPFVPVAIADLQSRWLGQTVEQLVDAFRTARRRAPCLLFIDELDAIVPERGAASLQHEDRKVVNAFLTESVALRGTGVVLVAATNRLDRLDPAAVREGRFDLRVEVPPPDLEARVGLLRAELARVAPHLEVDPHEAARAARRWAGVSAARIAAVARELAALHPAPAPARSRRRGTAVVALQAQDLLDAAARLGSRSHPLPAETPGLDRLYLAPTRLQRLRAIAWRLRHPLEAEDAGATTPGGLLFTGPTGSGKTAAALALARETGSSLFTVTGTELLVDPGRLDDLVQRARDARPAIVLVDDADDLVADRRTGRWPAATQRLIAALDATHALGGDFTWIVVARDAGDIDPALRRGGRLDEAVTFGPPSADALRACVADWFRQRDWIPEPHVEAIAAALDGHGIPDAITRLQSALHARIAATDGTGARRLTAADVQRAADPDEDAPAPATTPPPGNVDRPRRFTPRVHTTHGSG